MKPHGDVGIFEKRVTAAGDSDTASQAAGTCRPRLAGARAQGLPGCLDCWWLQVLLHNPAACCWQCALVQLVNVHCRVNAQFGVSWDHSAALSIDYACTVGRDIHERVGMCRKRVLGRIRELLDDCGKAPPPRILVTGESINCSMRQFQLPL